MARRAAWGVMVVLAVAVGAYALAVALAPGLRSSFVEALFREKALRAAGHLTAGGVSIVAGAVQFSGRLRVERPAVHRLVGKVYLAAVLVSGASALLLAPVSSGGMAAHAGFGLMAILWLGTAGVAYASVRDGAYEAHRAWMIRSYAICLGAVTLRVYLPLSQVAGIPFAEAYPAIAWLCWVPNLLVAEWLVVPGSFAPLDPDPVGEPLAEPRSGRAA